ncbi:MAG: PP2C family protein-serine/threonine phosphatase, partial [Nocardioides sp.]
VEQIALQQLGCLHAGIWLRDSPTDETGDRLVFVESPDNEWLSAKLNAVLPLDATNPLGEAIVTAAPLHFATKVEQNAAYPHLNLTAQVGDARSFVPLKSRRTAIGALALVWDGPHLLSQADRLTIEALAEYTSQAVQRVALVQERLDALLTLQSSMLPRLPAPEHLELAARYRPADARDQVGGDWYDAVVTRSGAINLMIGDVVGHNLEAAAVMGQLRHMLRAIAWAVDDVPSANVARLDQAVEDLGVDGMASLVYARVEPRTSPRERTVIWTNAGHPPPLVVDASGQVQVLDDSPDLMLGVDPTLARSDSSVTVPVGSLLLFYTDGLVERRGEDIADGLERLTAAVAQAHALPTGALLDSVLAALAVGRLDDDVAMLAVRVHE